MEVQTLLQLITAISTMIIAIAGVLMAFFFAYIPRKKTQTIDSLRKELLDCYQNIASLLIIEQDYMDEESIGKQSTRKGLYFSNKVQPKHVEKRIEQLQNNL
ncbi:MAG: hypothetical protein MJZ79_04225 [Paludibacteraceae bacterium]|nr:hypothetical protein [Paludibacteraceae bacterium]